MDYNSTGQYNYNYPPAPPPEPPAQQVTNGKSIAAMVLGILSIVLPYLGFIIGIIAIIMSTISFKELKQTNEQGRGFATAGLVCGIIGTVLYGIIVLFLVIVAIFAFSETSNELINYSNF
ncbi:DUF4190 domain-containing protein [Paenibacillus fonticola]|uniref:DUF4190 domain-containing protein n=1 Tax=Paenibacillus fonticola TaxID=379896 RepID=UPI0003605C3F|nr:DUF4190 domain-containing protein [Paenibacillus fonticola]